MADNYLVTFLCDGSKGEPTTANNTHIKAVKVSLAQAFGVPAAEAHFSAQYRLSAGVTAGQGRAAVSLRARTASRWL